MNGSLYLEDFTVGQNFTSGTHVITKDEIKQFAGVYDPQPFHLDDDAASKSVFNGLAASGWHTAALTMRLLVLSFPVSGGMVGAGVEITWPRPTRVGDKLQVFSEIVEITPSRSKPDRGIVRLRSETRNQHDEVVQVLTSKLVVPRQPRMANS